MKGICILAVGLSIINAYADLPCHAAEGTNQPSDAVRAGTQTVDRVDITTQSGQVYKNAKITRVEPDGITVMYSKGIAKVPFTDLSEEYRKEYGYDPEQASAYSIKMAEERQRAYSRQRQREQEAAEAAASEQKVKELVQSVKKIAEVNAKARRALAERRQAGRALTSDCRVLMGCSKDEVTAIIGAPSFTGSSGSTWFHRGFIDPDSGDYETVHLDFEEGRVSDVGW